MRNELSYSIIIVTYNSELFIQKAIESIDQQKITPKKIIIVDTGSSNHDYLAPYIKRPDVLFIQAKQNAGFCVGNNLGFQALPEDTKYFLLLNPDAFLFPDSMTLALEFMEKKENRSCGLLTGTLYGYDIKKNLPKSSYDSTGIFNTWYGKWYDRGQGELIESNKYNAIEEIPAACGAFMFCRKEAIDSNLVRNSELFDSHFYMYKEDIDLSCRLRKKGWKIFFNPNVQAYHCRGWNPNRKEMSRKVRLFSSRNELKIHFRMCSIPGILYSLIKYISVYFMNI